MIELEADKLRATVALMRELGIVEGFGLKLGPPPRPPGGLAVVAHELSEQEKREAARAQRLEALRQEVRDRLAGSGREYSNAEIDRFLPETW